jgi:hypothetical protein
LLYNHVNAKHILLFYIKTSMMMNQYKLCVRTSEREEMFFFSAISYNLIRMLLTFLIHHFSISVIQIINKNNNVEGKKESKTHDRVDMEVKPINIYLHVGMIFQQNIFLSLSHSYLNQICAREGRAS